MKKDILEIKKLILKDINLKHIGDGSFDADQEFDEYFEDLFLGISLKNNILYIYYSNCPGRTYTTYIWNKSKKEFKDFIDMIDNISRRENILNIAFNLL